MRQLVKPAEVEKGLKSPMRKILHFSSGLQKRNRKSESQSRADKPTQLEPASQFQEHLREKFKKVQDNTGLNRGQKAETACRANPHRIKPVKNILY
jgi:hypothetical protein